ncbi:hypothetical protein OMK64_14980 [Cellulomonas fimi]|uniref:hypothetical protein n=1 Tax=Cellulomonas fimi TaxID=1708 RepID=UPI00234D57A2|nr:hypothetical protein [Cellulomonas fimi]MDC7122838.1 hypothetical protein [Cellulomonas fimi]
MTDVRFLLGIRAQPDDDDLTFVAPEVVLADRDAHAATLSDVVAGYAGGALELTVGHDTAHVEDTLRYLVLGVCFQSVPPLLRGEEFVHDYTESGFPALVLRPRGDLVEVSGREVVPVSSPRDTLVAALLACGERYLALLRDLGAHPDDLRLLTDAADEARAAQRNV